MGQVLPNIAEQAGGMGPENRLGRRLAAQEEEGADDNDRGENADAEAQPFFKVFPSLLQGGYGAVGRYRGDDQHDQRRAAHQGRGVASLQLQRQHQHDIAQKDQRRDQRDHHRPAGGLMAGLLPGRRGGQRQPAHIAAEQDIGGRGGHQAHDQPQRNRPGDQQAHVAAGRLGGDGGRALNEEIAGKGHAMAKKIERDRRPQGGDAGLDGRWQHQGPYQSHGGRGPDEPGDDQHHKAQRKKGAGAVDHPPGKGADQKGVGAQGRQGPGHGHHDGDDDDDTPKFGARPDQRVKEPLERAGNRAGPT